MADSRLCYKYILLLYLTEQVQADILQIDAHLIAVLFVPRDRPPGGGMGDPCGGLLARAVAVSVSDHFIDFVIVGEIKYNGQMVLINIHGNDGDHGGGHFNVIKLV